MTFEMALLLGPEERLDLSNKKSFLIELSRDVRTTNGRPQFVVEICLTNLDQKEKFPCGFSSDISQQTPLPLLSHVLAISILMLHAATIRKS